MSTATGRPKHAPLGETSPALLAAPGFTARRLYQAYLAIWLREVSSTLTGPQFAVLAQVHESPGVDQSSLASLVSLDTSTMTDVAQRLEDKGLLARLTDAADGRRKLLHLTADGERVLAETTRRARTLDRTLLAPYSQAEEAALRAQLEILVAHWESLAAGRR